MPHWEAASKEARTLLRAFGAHYTTRLFSLNQNRRLKWHGQERYLPLLAVPAAFALLYQAARAHRINHLFSSGGERLLAPRLAGPASIITICKEPGSIDAFERNRRHLARFAYVVVETKRHQELLEQCGIDRRRIKLIHPPAATAPYAPARPPFKILFASSPPAPNQFLSRGIFLILRVAARLPQVQFVLVWRDRHHEALLGLIEDAGVDNVSVINGYVDDMGALYDTAHATVLAGHEHTSFKPAPHSALEIARPRQAGARDADLLDRRSGRRARLRHRVRAEHRRLRGGDPRHDGTLRRDPGGLPGIGRGLLLAGGVHRALPAAVRGAAEQRGARAAASGGEGARHGRSGRAAVAIRALALRAPVG